ncbi:MAG: nucleoside hydrolase [Planctomycetota bacterium]
MPVLNTELLSRCDLIRERMDDAQRVARLRPPSLSDGRVDAVLDTDTFNEIDDQFALAYLLLSPKQIRTQAVYAAPFENAHRAETPAEGMRQSYDEALRVFDRLGRTDGPAIARRGAERWLKDADPAPNPATQDLTERAMSRPIDGPPLYVLAIGAPTNVSTALLLEPALAERIVVVWLGGHPNGWRHTHEFNLMQDPPATRVLLDSGVPLVRVPCINVAQRLRTCVPELREALSGRNALCDFLFERFAEYEDYERPGRERNNGGRPVAYGKEIWDVSVVAWLVDPDWCPSQLTPSPQLTTTADGLLRWSIDPHRHTIRELDEIDRDAVFGDMLAKLTGQADPS